MEKLPETLIDSNTGLCVSDAMTELEARKAGQAREQSIFSKSQGHCTSEGNNTRSTGFILNRAPPLTSYVNWAIAWASVSPIVTWKCEHKRAT